MNSTLERPPVKPKIHTPLRLDSVAVLDRFVSTVKHLSARTHEDGMAPLDSSGNRLGYEIEARPRLPINPWKMRVYASGGQTIADGTGPTVAFANVSYDGTSGWSTSNNQWTVPLSGYYQANASLYIQAPANGTITYSAGPITLWQVGASNAISQGNQNQFYNGGGFLNPFVSPMPLNDIVLLNQGDLVFLKCAVSSNGSGNWTVQGSGAPGYFSFWSMQLISA
jgi:hypothetical protein